jgi:hypothetical protein
MANATEVTEDRDHAARHIDRQRQPRSLQRLARRPIYDDDIDQRVIDLHDFISALGDIFAGNRLETIPRRLCAVPRSRELGRIDRVDAGSQSMPAGRFEPSRAA